MSGYNNVSPFSVNRVLTSDYERDRKFESIWLVYICMGFSEILF